MKQLLAVLLLGLLLVLGFSTCVKDDVQHLVDDIQAYQRQSLLPIQ